MKKVIRKKSRRIKKTKSSKKPLIIFLIICLLAVLGLLRILLNSNYSTTSVPKVKIDKHSKKQLLYPTPVSVRVPILLYHYIQDVQDKRDTIRQSLNIDPIIFEQQIKTLKDAGFTFLTATDMADILDGKMQAPLKPVVITIDDGHWDLYTDILPIIKKYNAKATAYIIPGFLNGSDFLSTAQLQIVAENGLIEIGAHTVNHMWLKGQTLDVVQKEVKDSKSLLEEIIKKPVVSFAYPSGAFDKQAEDVVKTAGFRTAVSTMLGAEVSQNNRYYLFRIRPGRRTGEEFIQYLNNPIP